MFGIGINSLGMLALAVVAISYAHHASRGRPLRGVRGWLLFFCIGLTVVQPLMFALQATRAVEFLVGAKVDEAILVYEVAWLLCGVFLSGFGFFAGISLWRGDPRGPSRAEGFLGTLVVVSISLAFLLLVLALSEGPDDLSPEVVAIAIRLVGGSIVYATFWSVYLARSRRVAETFSSKLVQPGSVDEALQSEPPASPVGTTPPLPMDGFATGRQNAPTLAEQAGHQEVRCDRCGAYLYGAQVQHGRCASCEKRA